MIYYFDGEATRPQQFNSWADWESQNLLAGPLDYWQYGPARFTVASIHNSDITTDVFMSHDCDGTPAQEMSRADANRMLDYLWTSHQKGDKIFTWNGTGFDWRILAANTGELDACVELALTSYDPAFQVLCIKGMMPSLDGVLSGFGLPNKPMKGSKAPEKWENGEFNEVVQYVISDTTNLRAVVGKIAKNYGVRWIAHSGNMNFVPFAKGFLTVEECLTLPKPNVAWMTTPMLREHVIRWFTHREEWENE